MRKNFYTTSPDDVQPGDEFVCAIKAIVTETGVRLYRCEYPEDLPMPQGTRVPGECDFSTTLFPVLTRWLENKLRL